LADSVFNSQHTQVNKRTVTRIHPTLPADCDTSPGQNCDLGPTLNTHYTTQIKTVMAKTINLFSSFSGKVQE